MAFLLFLTQFIECSVMVLIPLSLTSCSQYKAIQMLNISSAGVFTFLLTAYINWQHKCEFLCILTLLFFLLLLRFRRTSITPSSVTIFLILNLGLVLVLLRVFLCLAMTGEEPSMDSTPDDVESWNPIYNISLKIKENFYNSK